MNYDYSKRSYQIYSPLGKSIEKELFAGFFLFEIPPLIPSSVSASEFDLLKAVSGIVVS